MATTIIISNIVPCSGGEHLKFTGTINGNAFSRTILRSDLLVLDEDSTVEQRAIYRFRSAALEAGATTPVQVKNAIVGKTFIV